MNLILNSSVGEIVLEQTLLQQTNNEVDLSRLNTGVYIIRTNQGIQRKLLIK